MSRPTELQLQLADVRRWLDSLTAAADKGALPDVADARLLREYAEHAEQMVVYAHIKALRSNTPEQDKDAQRVMARQHNQRADKAAKGAA